MAKAPKARRTAAAEPAADGFWDRPAMMNLVADLLLVVGITGLAWAVVAAVQRLPFFPMSQVVVVGNIEQVTRVQIEQAARSSLAGNFFTVDLADVRSAFEKLPWVRRADVRLRWPDAVEVAIEEHVAVARWRKADGESRLVNDQGEVFAAASERQLPTFAGPEGSSARVLARYREFTTTLAAADHRPETVVLSGREAWQVRLDDGVLIELGRDDERHGISERLGRFVAHYRSALDKLHLARAGVVDMRYPNGFTLRPDSRS